MSQQLSTESESEHSNGVSECFLTDCPGCVLCQNQEVLTATERIRQAEETLRWLQLLVTDTTRQLEHLLALRSLLCNHIWNIGETQETCIRCFLVRDRPEPEDPATP